MWYNKDMKKIILLLVFLILNTIKIDALTFISKDQEIQLISDEFKYYDKFNYYTYINIKEKYINYQISVAGYKQLTATLILNPKVFDTLENIIVEQYNDDADSWEKVLFNVVENTIVMEVRSLGKFRIYKEEVATSESNNHYIIFLISFSILSLVIFALVFYSKNYLLE